MALFPFRVLGQLTTAETLFVSNLAGLAYAQGDILYYDGSNLNRLPAGTSGWFLKTQGVGANPTWVAVPGGGDVLKVGTPANNQVGVWTGDGTIEGDAALTFDTATDVLSTGGIALSSATQDTIAAFTTASKTITSLALATYPSLTELSYVKGVTSAIQTQLNAKGVGDMTLAGVQSVTGLKTFDASKLAMKGSSTGVTTIASANASATDYTITLPAAAGTVALTTFADNTGFVDENGNEQLWFQTTASAVNYLEIQNGATLTNPTIRGEGSDANIGITFITKGTGTVVIPIATISTGIVPSANDGAYLGTSSLQFSDLFLASGSVINWDNGNLALTHSADILTLSSTATGATGPTLELYQDSATPAPSDIVGTVAFYGEDSVGNKQAYSTIKGKISSATSTSEEGYVIFSVATAGTLTDKLELSSSYLAPYTSNNISLGASALQWSDLFLAEGGVINFDNGDVTVTQTGNVLAVAGGDLRVATADVGTNADSVPTISSTNTFTNKRVTKRTGTTTSHATPTINTDNVDEYYITAQTEAITSFTTNLSGTPTEGQMLFISVVGTAARGITWGASFGNGPVALPTTTVTTTQLSTLFKWSTSASKWLCYATGSTV